MVFEYDHDVVFIAQNYPYPYTQMVKHVTHLEGKFKSHTKM